MFLIPAVGFAVLQYWLTRSRAAVGIKWLPFFTVVGVGAVTGLAAFNQIGLPHTHFFDRHSMFPLPDYVYLALISGCALGGIALGALVGAANPKDK